MRAKLEAGRRIYAIGDLHGRLDLLQALVEEICQDLDGYEGRAQVVMLGDYVDRGDESFAVIERLRQGARGLGLPEGVSLLCLKGNHEDLFLRALEGTETWPIWLANGGEETCLSYGLDPGSLNGGSRLAQLKDALAAKVPSGHRRFLRCLPLTYTAGDYFFCHAGVRPGVPLDRQVEEDLIWIRQSFLAASDCHGKVIVHGHTPVQLPEVRPNRIGIDTGAVYGGLLTALVLEGEERHFIQV